MYHVEQESIHFQEGSGVWGEISVPFCLFISMPVTPCGTKTREGEWLVLNGSRLDLKSAIRAVQEFLLKINQILPRHAVFAGYSEKDALLN